MLELTASPVACCCEGVPRIASTGIFRPVIPQPATCGTLPVSFDRFASGIGAELVHNPVNQPNGSRDALQGAGRFRDMSPRVSPQGERNGAFRHLKARPCESVRAITPASVAVRWVGFGGGGHNFGSCPPWRS